MGFGFGSRTMGEHHQKSPAFASPSSTDADSESQTSSTKTCVREEYRRETYEQNTNKRICLQTPTTQELTLRIGLLARFLFSYQVYVAIPNQDFLFLKNPSNYFYKIYIQPPANPISSMYGIFTNIYPINEPNVGKYTIIYTIHGASGNILF